MASFEMIGRVIAACVLAFELTQFVEYWLKLQAQDYDSIVAVKIGVSEEKDYYNDKNYHMFMTINAFMVSVISIYFLLKTLGLDVPIFGKPVEALANEIIAGKNNLLKFARGEKDAPSLLSNFTIAGILLAVSIMAYQFLNASEHIMKASKEDYSTYLAEKWGTSEEMNKGYFILMTIASVSLLITTSMYVLKLFGLDSTVNRIPGVSETTSLLKEGREGLKTGLTSVTRRIR